MIYPLLLSSPVKDYLWGGTRLKSEYGFTCGGERAAEAWLLSCHKDGESTVKNGPFAGMTLSDAIAAMGEDALGEDSKKFPYFPLLIKLIDAKDRLSVQVHPGNEYALKNEGEYGKTEMWYVVDCDEGSRLIYGLNRSVRKDELEHRIRNNSLGEICNFVPVKKGDVFYIEAGTLHAIGKGILIAEIQQNSNVTYRVSDYGRLGADGKPRPLHIAKAVDVINCYPVKNRKDESEITIYPFGIVKSLAVSEFFTVDLLQLKGRAGLMEKKSFLSIVVLDGEMVMSFAFGMMRLKKGDSVFIPARLCVTLTGEAEVICSHI